MIDKSDSSWTSSPVWVKVGLWLINSRKTALAFETFSVIVALVSFVVAFWFFPAMIGLVFFGSAYWYAAAIRWADNRGLWRDAQESRPAQT